MICDESTTEGEDDYRNSSGNGSVKGESGTEYILINRCTDHLNEQRNESTHCKTSQDPCQKKVEKGGTENKQKHTKGADQGNEQQQPGVPSFFMIPPE